MRPVARTHRSLRTAWTRRRAGRGFSYLDENGERLPPSELERVRSLAIPPAWRNVRIAASPKAKLQAMGVDAAGRTQYLYNAAWRARQEARKFDRALALAQRLPHIRRAVTRDLRGDRGARIQALAAAIRLIDRAGVRVGSRRYARENGTYGVTTIQRRHVKVDEGRIAFDFPGKSGSTWRFELRDRELAAYFESLPRRRPGRPAMGYDDGGGFQRIGASSVNEYLRDIAGMEASAKDLRTWRGTATAAASLDASHAAGRNAEAAWKKAIDDASSWLNNTPAVARGSYVDPLLLEAYRAGRTARTDAAAARLLTEMRERSTSLAQRA
ncbi:DNA topoisomerase IB [Sinomonas humi]|uniref:DNA topoisomerase n=1 Tax=Sinomonas humi TaxID=1338436 RepID=A0A0B2AL44_9MICC|nr:DNA topoisomerase IB [Sinomonas humi]KHL02556.1 hypothetical protein LK10_12060 [Sinomonas humi]